MRNDNNRWEEMDKIVLNRALIKSGICPKCNETLKPVALLEKVWGCKTCKQTWHIESDI